MITFLLTDFSIKNNINFFTNASSPKSSKSLEQLLQSLVVTIIAGDEGLVDPGVLKPEVLELEEDPEVLGRGLLVPGLEVEHVDDPRLVLVGLVVVGGRLAEGEDVDEPVDGEAVADDVLAILVVHDLR